MTFAVAKANTWEVAEYMYLNTDANWSGYDAGSCKRISRTSIRCLYMVWEDVYSDAGIFLDTLVCGNHVFSSYDRRNRVRTEFGDGPVCLWDSEM